MWPDCSPPSLAPRRTIFPHKHADRPTLVRTRGAAPVFPRPVQSPGWPSHGGNDGVIRQAAADPAGADPPEVEDVVAIHHPAFGIDGHYPVGVAVEGEAKVGLVGF